MTQPETILYAGYGANRDPQMIKEITGREPYVIGRVALKDVELCIQRFDQIPTEVVSTAPVPVAAREIMIDSWGQQSDFETYTVRPREGSMVDGMLFELSPEERALISEWELIEFGWYERLPVTVVLEDGSEKLAETEGLRDGQEIDRVVSGSRYSTYLNDPADMYKIAKKSRREYFERQAQGQ